MKRSVLILITALVLGASSFAGAYWVAPRASVMCCAHPEDDLDWLRTEFHLGTAEMTRIRALHEGYLPKCAEMCAKIATKQSELDLLAGNGTNLTMDAQSKLQDIAALRAQCQARMMEHFTSVSQAMPPAQGQRYLSEMKRLTLGNHEQMEHSMSGNTGHEHSH